MPFPHFRYNTLSRLAQLAPFAGRLRQAIQDYPESNAVLVRRHGVYVWGKDWIQAKTQAECYDYLFEAALRMKSLGIDASLPQAHAPLQNSLANGHGKESAPLCPSHAEHMLFVDVSWLQRVQDFFGDEQKRSCQSCCSRAAELHSHVHALEFVRVSAKCRAKLMPATCHACASIWYRHADGGPVSKKARLGRATAGQPKAVVLDIEGTVAPISFVTETLFPYARARAAQHLAATYDTEETQADLDLLRQQVRRRVSIRKCHMPLLGTPWAVKGAASIAMAGQLYLRPIVHPACRHVSWHLPCLTCITKVLSPSGGPWCILLRALLTQWICLN